MRRLLAVCAVPFPGGAEIGLLRLLRRLDGWAPLVTTPEAGASTVVSDTASVADRSPVPALERSARAVATSARARPSSAMAASSSASLARSRSLRRLVRSSAAVAASSRTSDARTRAFAAATAD